MQAPAGRFEVMVVRYRDEHGRFSAVAMESYVLRVVVERRRSILEGDMWRSADAARRLLPPARSG